MQRVPIGGSLILEALGFSVNGPAIFVIGFIALRALTCDAGLPEDELRECLLGSTETDEHPPLDVRASIVTRIIKDGEDLTGMLSLLDALSFE